MSKGSVLVFAAALSFAAAIVPAQTALGSRIILPIELVAGEPVTLAVLDASGRIVSGAKLSLSNGEQLKTDDSGRAHFLAPSDAGVLFARILGTETRAAGDVVRPEGTNDLHLNDAPRLVSMKDRITIRGTGFDGDADRNGVSIGGKPAFVLAASPVELVVLAPADVTPGANQVAVKVREHEFTTQITLVDLIFPAVGRGMRPNQKSQLNFEARGTDQPLELELRNLSPTVIRFKHGERELVRTRGGTQNSASVQVKALRAGEYSISARLTPHPGTPIVEAARDFLTAAQKDAPLSEKKRIGKILGELQRKTPNIQAARKEFEKLLPPNALGDYEALIRGAREALFGEE